MLKARQVRYFNRSFTFKLEKQFFEHSIVYHAISSFIWKCWMEINKINVAFNVDFVKILRKDTTTWAFQLFFESFRTQSRAPIQSTTRKIQVQNIFEFVRSKNLPSKSIFTLGGAYLNSTPPTTLHPISSSHILKRRLHTNEKLFTQFGVQSRWDSRPTKINTSNTK